MDTICHLCNYADNGPVFVQGPPGSFCVTGQRFRGIDLETGENTFCENNTICATILTQPLRILDSNQLFVAEIQKKGSRFKRFII